MPTWKRQRLDGPKPTLGDVTDGVNHGPSTRLPAWEHMDGSISKRRGRRIAVGRPHPDNGGIDDPIDLVSLAIPSPDDRGPAILDRLPPEVLDLIFSIDSNLELRDHLALAGTCRHIRTCYTDIVFQVLFFSHYPHLATNSVEHIYFSTSSTVPTILLRPIKLLGRSAPRPLSHARYIFSQAGKHAAGGWDGWGLNRTEWERGESERTLAKHELLVASLGVGRTILRKAVLAGEPYAVDDGGRFMSSGMLSASVQPSEVGSGMGRRVSRPPRAWPDSSKRGTGLKTEQHKGYDPWESEWRAKIAESVNMPLISALDAVRLYKVSGKDLPANRYGFHHKYISSAIQAIAQRRDQQAAQIEAASV